MVESISVLMLDDDRLALRHIEKLVDWQALGYAQPVMCTSIDEARRTCARQRFQVFLLDIEVPGGNGLDFAQEVKARQPEAYVIMLTSYREFQYARSAVSLGAFDYHIKHELTGEKLSEQLTCIRSQLEDRWASSQSMRETVFSMLLSEEPQNLDKLCPMLALEGRVFTLFHIHKPVTWPRAAVDKACLRDAEAAVRRTGALICCDETGLWVLVSADNRLALRDVNATVETLLGSVQLSVSISEMLSAPEQVPLWRRCCLREEAERFVKGEPYNVQRVPIGFVDDGNEEDDPNPLLRAWAVQDIGGVRRELARWSATVARHRQPIEALERLAEHLRQNCGIAPPEEPFSSLRAVTRWLEQELCAAWDTRAELSDISVHTRQMIQYLREHPAASMAELSQEMGMSEGYLRMVFKKDMRQTIADYMLARRMEQAKYLLRVRKMRVYDVARMLHYQSAQYFSHVFRKYTGMAPAAYAQAKGEDSP